MHLLVISPENCSIHHSRLLQAISTGLCCFFKGISNNILTYFDCNLHPYCRLNESEMVNDTNIGPYLEEVRLSSASTLLQ